MALQALTIRIDEDIARELRIFAALEDKTVNDIVRQKIEEYRREVRLIPGLEEKLDGLLQASKEALEAQDGLVPQSQ